MLKGIRAKDIRDFQKYSAKLDEVMQRIREYKPEAYIYATPQTFNLMAGVLPGERPWWQEQDEFLVVSERCESLEAGDW